MHTNFFIENLKSLFNIYNVMVLIQDYDKLCFYIIVFFMSLMIVALLLMLIYSSYNNYYIGIKSIISQPLSKIDF